jgi:hypothetical protein
MEHRGYRGTVKYNPGEGVYEGQVELLKDTVTYQADCLVRLEQAFREAIDTYIEACLGCEEIPEPPPPRVSAGEHRRTRNGPGDDLSRPAAPVWLHDHARGVSAGAAPAPRG